MEISGKEYWSGLLFPAPGDLPDPGMETKSPVFPALQVDSLPTEVITKTKNRGKCISFEVRLTFFFLHCKFFLKKKTYTYIYSFTNSFRI